VPLIGVGQDDCGVWGPKKFMGREYDGIYRTTFLIYENGIIEDIIEKVNTKEHTTQILK
jgi:thioredoxin-dependent peroxiredoxin